MEIIQIVSIGFIATILAVILKRNGQNFQCLLYWLQE